VASGHRVLGALVLTGVPIVDAEAGCASGAAALALGAAFIRSGQHEAVLVVEVEKMPKGIIRSSFFAPWQEEAGLSANPAYFALRAQRLLRDQGLGVDDLAAPEWSQDPPVTNGWPTTPGPPAPSGTTTTGAAASASPRSHCPMVSQPSDADRPTVAQDAAHRSKGVTHGPPRDERLWLEPRDRCRRSNRRFCWLNDQFADELIEEFLAYNQNVKVMKLSMLEDQVTPAKSCASDTAISCGVAAGPTCRL
jgi:hypothetical protein